MSNVSIQSESRGTTQLFWLIWNGALGVTCIIVGVITLQMGHIGNQTSVGVTLIVTGFGYICLCMKEDWDNGLNTAITIFLCWFWAFYTITIVFSSISGFDIPFIINVSHLPQVYKFVFCLVLCVFIVLAGFRLAHLWRYDEKEKKAN
jgi:hypothetical protein